MRSEPITIPSPLPTEALNTPMTPDLKPLLAPESIALVGASEGKSYGARPFPLLRSWGFPGDIYQVNPQHVRLHGERCWNSVSELPKAVDLAILMVRRESVLGTLRECATARIPAAIVIASDFADSTDQRGPQLQRQLVEFAAHSKMSIMGPNCLGVVNVHGATPAFCGPIGAPLLSGNLSVLSQSGGNVGAFIEGAYGRHLGLSYALSYGNAACVDLADYIDYLLDDANTEVICAFIEALGDPERFAAAALRAARAQKPIIAIKVGQSRGGKAAALAHTGSLAGRDEYIHALFNETGVLRADTIDEALDRALIFALAPRRRWPKGERLAVVTIGGGAAAMFADLAEKSGLSLAKPPPALRGILGRHDRFAPKLQNPLDLSGALLSEVPDLLGDVVSSCLDDKRNDAVVIVGEPRQRVLSFVASMAKPMRSLDKLTIFATIAGTAVSSDMRDVAAENPDVPQVTSIDRMVRAYTAALQYARSRPRNPFETSNRPRRSALELVAGCSSGAVLDGERTSALLELYGVPFVAQAWASTPEEATALAEELGYPVAVKLDGVAHKSEAGGVRLGLANARDVRHAVRLLTQSGTVHQDPQRVVVQRMLPTGPEIHIGVIHGDPAFPPLIVVAAGGVAVEIDPDVATRFAPVDRLLALDMIRSLRIYPRLGVFRKQPPRDLSAVAKAIVAVSRMASELRQFVHSADLNPLIVGAKGDGAPAVDALVVLHASITADKNQGQPPRTDQLVTQGLSD